MATYIIWDDYLFIIWSSQKNKISKVALNFCKRMFKSLPIIKYLNPIKCQMLIQFCQICKILPNLVTLVSTNSDRNIWATEKRGVQVHNQLFNSYNAKTTDVHDRILDNIKPFCSNILDHYRQFCSNFLSNIANTF